MAGVVYEIDTHELESLGGKIEIFPREARRAMVASANRALSKIITNTATEVKKNYSTIKRKDIKDIAVTKKATFSNLEASVTYTGKQLRASTFPHTISRSRNRSPVNLRIRTASVKSSPTPAMFGEKAGGSRGVRGTREIYKREPNTRKVKTVYTLSIPQMISNETVYKQIQDQAKKDYADRFVHEFEYRISTLK